MYQCTGKTKVIVISDVVVASKEHIAKLLSQDQTVLAVDKHGCSGACGKQTQDNQATQKKKPFGVYCLTVSDRAFKGEYESGDLSGKAMLECI